MQRILLTYLNDWVRDNSRKPILLRGARQVGKSWLAKELGKKFERYAEINFDKNPELATLFEQEILLKSL